MEAAAVAGTTVVCAVPVGFAVQHVLNAVRALRLYVFDGRGDVFVNAKEVRTGRCKKVALLGREKVRARFKKAALDRRDEVRNLVEKEHMREGDVRVEAHNGYTSIDLRLVYKYGDDHGEATAPLQTIRPDNAARPGDWEKPVQLKPKENAMLVTYARRQSPRRLLSAADGSHLDGSKAAPFLTWQGETTGWELVEAWTVQRTESWDEAYCVRKVNELTTTERMALEEAVDAFARVLMALFPRTFNRNNIEYAETRTRSLDPVYRVPCTLQRRFLTDPKVQRQLGIKSFRDQQLVVYKVPTSLRSWLATLVTDSHVRWHRIAEDFDYVFYTRTGNKQMTNPQLSEDFDRERQADDNWNISELVRVPEEPLGDGAFGEVLLMKSLRDDRVYAVKFPKNPRNTPEAQERRNEMELLVNQLLRNRNPPNLAVVHNLYWSCDPNSKRPCRFAIVMDRYPTNLTNAVVDDPQADCVCFWKWTKEVHTGLMYMHTQLSPDGPVLHRDVKPDNVLLDRMGGRDATAYLADFGLSCVGRPTGPRRIPYGTQGFKAPEIVARDEHGEKADLYSLGVLAWWLDGNDIEGTTASTETDIPPERISERLLEKTVEVRARQGPSLTDFVQRLICLNPVDRMGHEEILGHPYFVERPAD